MLRSVDRRRGRGHPTLISERRIWRDGRRLSSAHSMTIWNALSITQIISSTGRSNEGFTLTSVSLQHTHVIPEERSHWRTLGTVKRRCHLQNRQSFDLCRTQRSWPNQSAWQRQLSRSRRQSGWSATTQCDPDGSASVVGRTEGADQR